MPCFTGIGSRCALHPPRSTPVQCETNCLERLLPEIFKVHRGGQNLGKVSRQWRKAGKLERRLEVYAQCIGEVQQAHEHVGRWWQIKRREGFEDGWQRFLD
jgi:hypothetical protein